ncbi:MAG: dihydroorotate dehydrogenase [Candidatus Omnitrophica bacterium]|nr:dihydroorotate dehydrogenase [Candidatus Omnitrophota bacterium]
MKPNLAVKIGRLKLKNPVMVASGTFGEEYGEMTDVSKLGAVVAKTITLKARVGNPPPRVCETDSGMLNSIGLENKGVEEFMSRKLLALKKFRVPVVVSIAGESEDELAELASRLKAVDALEVNLSCPNVKHGAREGLIAQDASAVAACISAVRKATKAPLIAKLTPNVTDIAKIAVSAESAGADAVLVANTFFGMAVDIYARRPKLGNICGGLSGPAIKPMSLKMVWDTARKVKIPVIGCGGIMDYKDAVEFMLCGASAIQVGTANFVAPDASAEIVKGIARYMSKNKIADISKLRGALLV